MSASRRKFLQIGAVGAAPLCRLIFAGEASVTYDPLMTGLEQLQPIFESAVCADSDSAANGSSILRAVIQRG